MIKNFGFITMLLFCFSGHAQLCDSLNLSIRKVRASDTDPRISWELATHQVFINNNCSQRNALLVYFPGSYDNPLNTMKFPSLAANLGFHVISLKYPNSVAAKSACGSSTDANCYLNFRKEIIEGVDYSPKTTVNDTDCINNRLIKLLQYLASSYPSEGWEQYYTEDHIEWSKVMTAGHSQGGGHAAVMGISHKLKRVIMFASPNDYSNHFNAPAPWLSTTFATDDSSFYGFNNIQDDVVPFNEQKQNWETMSFSNDDDTTSVDGFSNPFSNSKMLYTDLNGGSETSQNHNLVVRDSHTPIDQNGRPVFEDVWKYLLGIVSQPNSLSKPSSNYITVLQNPVSEDLTLSNIQASSLVQVSIIDFKGKVVQSINHPSTNKMKVSHLLPGIYFAVISTQSGKNVKIKFIKL